MTACFDTPKDKGNRGTVKCIEDAPVLEAGCAHGLTFDLWTKRVRRSSLDVTEIRVEDTVYRCIHRYGHGLWCEERKD